MKLRSNKTQLRKFQKNAKLKKGNFDKIFYTTRETKEEPKINPGVRGHKRHRVNEVRRMDAVRGTLRVWRDNDKFLDP